ncbi:sirohydrochlorin chelatase [Aquabacterium sp. CECT 9606]|uniref:sirohydrochlorin chelatase n=1 Tax=Aquabacterium sp. CECT 9606 TaxID=2845822 RepID=UPI001E3CE964|nr:CbiX/SirB N-terminal domain-containing protein [Aquabacterium sp. CECT 9606]CAH0355007.1 Sirohydrochlorin cobaltochelatase [Aquabacterium sp. CECT 9606]
MTSRGILLFAHGARDPNWARPFEAAADRLRERVAGSAHAEVRLAFLEFMVPNLHEAGASLAHAGCQQVTVVPLFLGAGGHVRKDLPLLMTELAEKHPQVQWTLSRAVGETDLLIQALADSAWSLAQPD